MKAGPAAPLELPATLRVFERGWLSSNNVLFLGAHGSALVDTGYVGHAAQTLALVEHGLMGRGLDLMLCTHLHSDHCGGNATLQNAFRPRTLIAGAEAATVAAWDTSALNFARTGQACAPFTFEGTLAPGDVVELGDLNWHVLAAPGHDPHAFMLHCPAEGILISADALWEHGFGVIFPELEDAAAFGATRTTLESIEALGVRLVIPGHGSPFADVSAALAEAYSRLDYLEADPARNARQGIKVLLKFLLLDERSMALDTLAARLEAIELVREANRRHLHLSGAELAEWVVRELVRLDAARIDGPRLVDH